MQGSVLINRRILMDVTSRKMPFDELEREPKLLQYCDSLQHLHTMFVPFRV